MKWFWDLSLIFFPGLVFKKKFRLHWETSKLLISRASDEQTEAKEVKMDKYDC